LIAVYGSHRIHSSIFTSALILAAATDQLSLLIENNIEQAALKPSYPDELFAFER
jgi:hypothetical protein